MMRLQLRLGAVPRKEAGVGPSPLGPLDCYSSVRRIGRVRHVGPPSPLRERSSPS
jgi:hypothetical protein